MKCSIIVANYNNGKFLSELIKSVKNQTYKNWELIIVDDASTDDSISIITSFLNDTRIKLIKLKKNRGAAVAFKTCIDNSDGEIIAMLGADDALLNNAIEEVINAHKLYPNASMIIPGLVCCNENLDITGEVIRFNENKKAKTILNQFGLSGWDTFKREYYKNTFGIDTEQLRALDQDLYFKLEEVGTLKPIEENLYLYRIHPMGISQQNNQSFAHEYNYLAIIKAYKRRKKTGFKNITEKRYTEVLMNYHYLKFVNTYKKRELKNISNQEADILTKLLDNKKTENINEVNIIFNLLETLNFEQKELVKKKIIKSYFIKKRYSLTILKELLNKNLKPHKYLSKKEVLKIFLKSILNWEVKKKKI